MAFGEARERMEGVLGKNKGYEQKSSSWEEEETDSCGQLFSLQSPAGGVHFFGAHYSPAREM